MQLFLKILIILSNSLKNNNASHLVNTYKLCQCRQAHNHSTSKLLFHHLEFCHIFILNSFDQLINNIIVNIFTTIILNIYSCFCLCHHKVQWIGEYLHIEHQQDKSLSFISLVVWFIPDTWQGKLFRNFYMINFILLPVHYT